MTFKTKVDIDRGKYFAAIKWATENFGIDYTFDRRYTDRLRWHVRAYKHQERFYFTNKDDAIIFALKWT